MLLDWGIHLMTTSYTRITTTKKGKTAKIPVTEYRDLGKQGKVPRLRVDMPAT